MGEPLLPQHPRTQSKLYKYKYLVNLYLLYQNKLRKINKKEPTLF